MLDNGHISATGALAGGVIEVGGGWQGTGPLAHASSVTLGQDVVLDASATDQGDGGTVVVWSDVHNAQGQTRVAGQLLARGGAQGGNGGRIETSGHVLDATGVRVDATASAGQGGQWLIDPYNVTIAASGATGTAYNSNFTAGATTTLLASDIQTALSAGTSVSITTGAAGSAGSDVGNISVTGAITKTGTSAATLTLTAANKIDISAAIGSTGTGLLTLVLDTGAGSGTVSSVLSGKLALTKQGAGTTTLSAQNTYSGTTTVDGGTLLLSNASGTLHRNNAIVVNNGGTLTTSGGANNQVFEISAAGTGSITINAGGLVTTGNNVAITLLGQSFVLAGGTLSSGTPNTSWGSWILDSGSALSVTADSTLSASQVNLRQTNTNFTVDTGATLNVTGTLTTSNGGGSPSGSGGNLYKMGAGTMVLSGANTYTGTYVTAGTLQVGAGGTTGSLGSGAISVANSTLAFNYSAGTYTVGSSSSARYVTLNNATVNVLSGTVTLAGYASGSGSASTPLMAVNIQGTTSLSANTGAALTLSGTTSNNYSHAMALQNAAALSSSGSVTLKVNGAGASGWNHAMGLYGSNSITATSGSTLTVNVTHAANDWALAQYGTTASTSVSGNVTFNLSSAGNWDLLATNTWGVASVYYGPSYSSTNGTLTFNLAGATTNGVHIGGAGTLNASATGAIVISGSPRLYLAAASTLNTGAGPLTINSPIDTNGQTLTFSGGGGNIALGGAVTGTGGLTFATTGVTTLGSTGNTYSGTTTINSGTVKAGAANTLSSNSTYVLNNTSGTSLDLNSYANTLGGLSGNGNLALSANLTVGANNASTTYGGVLSGTGALTKSGTGTLTLTGTHTYSGNTTISAGTLTIGGAGSLGAGSYAGNIANSGTFNYASTTDQTLSGVISGTGALQANGGATLALASYLSTTAQTVATDTTVQAFLNRLTGARHNGSYIGATAGLIGSPVYDAASNTATFRVEQFDGTYTKVVWVKLTQSGSNVQAAIDTSGNHSTGAAYIGGYYLGLLFPSSGFTNQTLATSANGAVGYGVDQLRLGATLTLTNTNTYTGTTTVGDGFLQVGAGATVGTLGTAGVTLNAPGTLVFNRSDDVTVSNVLSGAGNIKKIANNTLSLTGSNSFTGSSWIAQGSVRLGNGAALGNSNDVYVYGGASLMANWSSAQVQWLRRLYLGTDGQTVQGSGILGAMAGTVAHGNFGMFGMIGGRSITVRGSATSTISADFRSGDNTTANFDVASTGDASGVDLSLTAKFSHFEGSTWGYMSKTGAGTMQLSGASNNIGSATVYAGKLLLKDSGIINFGNGGLVVNSGAQAEFNVSTGLQPTASYVIAGAGTVSKTGAGTAILTGNNTWTGATSVDAGILQIGNGGGSGTLGNNSATAIAAGATVQFSRDGTELYINNSFSGLGTLKLIGNGVNTGYYRFVSGTNTMTTASGGIVLDKAYLRVVSPSNLGAANITVGDLASLVIIKTGTFSNNISITGAGHSGSSAIHMNSHDGAGDVTLSGQITLTGNASIAAVDNGNIIVTRGIVESGGSYGLTKNGARRLTLTGASTFSGDTTVNAGSLFLANTSGAALYSGLSAGRVVLYNNGTAARFAGYPGDWFSGVQMGAANQLGSHVTLRFSAGGSSHQMFELRGFNQTIGSIDYLAGRNVGIIQNTQSETLGSATLTVYQGIDSDFQGGFRNNGSNLAGTLSLVKEGTGKLTMSSSEHSYAPGTGTITVNAGTFQYGNGAVMANPGWSRVTIASGATFTLYNPTTTELNFSTPEIVGAGTFKVAGITSNGTGQVQINRNNANFTGSTVIANGGRIYLRNALGLGTSAIDIQSGADITITDEITVANSISVAGNGWLEGGGGKVGALRLDKGTLSGNITLTANATVGSAGTGGTISGAISGGYGVTINAGGWTGPITFTGANTYTGATIINAGSLAVSTLADAGQASGIGAAAATASNLQINNGTTLRYIGTGNASSNRNFTIQAGTTGNIDVTTAAAVLTLSGAATTTTGALQKQGLGTLVLTGANAYSGATTVNAGILQVGAGSTLGTLGSNTGNITVNSGATLVYNRSDNITVANVIAGAGSVQQIGTGTTTLTNSSTYTGGTTVNAGTLKLSYGSGGYGTITGTLTVNSGGNLEYGIDNSFGWVSGRSVNVLNVNGTGVVGGGNYTQHFWNNFTLNMTGGTLKLGGGYNEWHNPTLNIGASATASLIQRTTGNTNAPMNLRDGTWMTVNTAAGATLNISVPVMQSTSSGSGGFNKNGAGTLILSGAVTHGYLGGSYLWGGSVQVAAGSTVSGTSDVRVANGASLDVYGIMTVGANGIFSVGSSYGNTGTANVYTGGVLNIGNGGGTYIGGKINNWNAAGAGVLNIDGGTVNAGAPGGSGNNYDYNWLWINPWGDNRSGSAINVINGGVLNLNRAINNGDSGAKTININNGTVRMSSQNAWSYMISGGFTVNTTNNATFDTNGTNAYIYSPIAGTGTVTHIGTGDLYLQGTNTYTGDTFNNAGAVHIDAGGTLGGGSYAGRIVNNGAGFYIQSTASQTLSGVISGTGVFGKWNTGTLTLTAQNTYTGDTQIDNGTLVLSHASGSVLASANVILGMGDGNQPNLRMSHNNQFGAGTVLTTLNTWGNWARFDLRGTTQVLAGINSGSANTAGAIILQNIGLDAVGTQAGTLMLNGSGSYLFNGYVRDHDNNTATYKLNITKNGSGTQTFVNTGDTGFANQNSGAITVNSGTLVYGNGGSNSNFRVGNNAAVSIASGATFKYWRSDSQTLSNSFSGAGQIYLLGTNDGISNGQSWFGFSGNNSGFTGTWTSDAAALSISSQNNLGSASAMVNVLDKGDLMLQSNGAQTLANNLFIRGTGWANSDGKHGAIHAISGSNWTLNGNITLTGNARISGWATWTMAINGVISDGGSGYSFEKFGLGGASLGTLTLSGLNTYTGATLINAGTLVTANLQNGGTASGIGASTSAAGNLVISNGTLRYTGATTSIDRNFTLGTGTTGSIDVTTAATTLTLSGAAASSTGAFQKLGLGTVVFTGANMYSGVTTVSGGALVVGAGGTVGTLGTSTGTITVNNATLAFNRSDNVTVANVITGNGNLNQTGSGTTTLTGDNSYTGATNITAGRLKIAPTATGIFSASSSFNISSGATLEYNIAAGREYYGSDSYVTYTGSGTIEKTGTGLADLYFSAGGKMQLNADAQVKVLEGVMRLAYGASGNWVSNQSDLYIASGATFRMWDATDVRFGALTGSGTYLQGDPTWGGGAAGTLTLGVNNHSGDFSGAMYDAARALGVTKTGTGTQTFSGRLSFANALTISQGTVQIGNGAASGLLNGGGHFDNRGMSVVNNAALIFNRAEDGLVDNVVISGTGTVQKIGAGKVTLTGNQSYTGATAVDAGILQMGNGGTSGLLANATTATIASGATLQYYRGDAQASTITVGHNLAGLGTFKVMSTGANGIGQYVYSGSNAMSASSAGIVIDKARMSVQTQANLGSNAPLLTVLDGGQLHIAKGVTLSNNMVLNGLGWKEPNGTQLGAICIDTGWTASALVTLTGNISLASNSRVTVLTNDATFSGVISGGFGLEKTGGRMLTLSGVNTYTGVTTITEGTLGVASLADGGSNSGIGASTNAAGNLLFKGGTLKYTGASTTIDRNFTLSTGSSGTFDIANAATNLTISGGAAATTGALVKTGAGTLTLTGSQLYTGTTNVNAGRLVIGGAGTLNNGAYAANMAMVSGATFQMDSTANQVLSGSIGGAGNLKKTNTGTLSLTGSNSYTGSSWIGGGTVTLGNAAALGSSNDVYIYDGGALMANWSTAQTQYFRNLYFGTDGVTAGTGGTLGAMPGAVINTTYGMFGLTGARTVTVGGTSTSTISTDLRVGNDATGTFNVGSTGDASGNDLLFSGKLSHFEGNTAGYFNKTGAGTMRLSGINAVHGMTVTAGKLVLEGSSAIQGTGQWADGPLWSTGLNNQGQVILQVDSGSALARFAIAGSGTLTKTGAGTAILLANNTYTGNTYVQAGTLQIGNAGTSGSLSQNTGAVGSASARTSVDISSGATLLYYRGDIQNVADVAVQHNLSGNGTFKVMSTGSNGAGQYRYYGTNSMLATASIVIDKARFGVYSQANLGVNAPNVTILDGGQVATGAAMTLSNNFSITGYGWREMDGSRLGAIHMNTTWNGAGTAGNVTLTGNITLPGGVAQISTWDGGDMTMSGVISGAGSLEKAGRRMLTLTGTNTYTGSTAVRGYTNFGTWFDGGVLSVSSLANGGSSSGIGASSNAAANLVLAGGTLRYTGASVATDRSFTLGMGDGTFDITNAATTVTVSGAAASTAYSLGKSGAGTLVLQGTNLYTGNTYLNAGTLKIDGTGSLNNGSYAGNITDNGTLVFNTSTNQALSGAISGSGTFTQSGSNTTTLSGNNSYTGDTTIAAGRLKITGGATSTSKMDIASGAVLEYSGLFGINRYITYTGQGDLEATGSSSTWMRLYSASGGKFAMGNNADIKVMSGQVFLDYGFNGDWTQNQASLYIASGAEFRMWDARDVRIGALTGGGMFRMGWANPGVYPSVLTLGVGNTSGTFSGIVVDDSYPLNMTKTGTGTQTFTGRLSFASGITINQGKVQIGDGSGTLNTITVFDHSNNTSTTTAGGDFANRGMGVTVASGAELVFNRGDAALVDNVYIAGAGVVRNIGSGTVTLTNNQGWTGNTYVDAGTLQIGNNSNTGTLGNNSAVTVASGATLKFFRSDQWVNIGNAISGAGQVYVMGNNDGVSNEQSLYRLQGNNANFTGLLTLDRAKVEISSQANIGASNASVNVKDKAQLTLLTNGAQTLTSNITLAGNGWGQGLGVLGALHGADGSNWTLNGTLTLAADARISGYGSWNITVNGVVGENGGSFALEKNGGGGGTQGVLTLTGANTYTGATKITAGTLSVASLADGGSNSNIGASTNAAGKLLFNGGTLKYTGVDATIDRSFTLMAGVNSNIEVSNAATTLTISGAAANTTGVFTKNGAGKLILTGNNLYTGSTTINAGVLEIGTAGKLGNGAYAGNMNIVSGAQFIMNSSANQTLSGSIGGGGSFTQNGSGTTTLSNSSTYTGGTTVNAGTLMLSYGSGGYGTITGTLTVNSGGAVDHGIDNSWGWIGGRSVNVLNINGTGVVGGGNYTQHFWNNFTLNMTGGTLKLGGSYNEWHNPTLNIGASATASVIERTSGNTTAPINLRDSTYMTVNTAAGGTLLVSAPINQSNGTSGITKNGAGEMILTGTSGYWGWTTVNAGTLRVGNHGTTGALGQGSANVTATGTLIFDRTDDALVQGTTFSGTGTIKQLGGGLLTLTANSGFSGSTLISNNSELQIGNNTNSGKLYGNVDIEAGSTLQYLRLNELGWSTYLQHTLSGAGTFRLKGSGILEQNSYTINRTSANFSGATIVEANARLGIDNTLGQYNTLGTSYITVQNLGGAYVAIGANTFTNSFSLEGLGWAETAGRLGALRTIGGTISGNVLMTGNTRIAAYFGEDGVISGAISDGGSNYSLEKWGTGRTTLTGASTYGGITYISDGQLKLANPTGAALYNGKTTGQVLIGHKTTWFGAWPNVASLLEFGANNQLGSHVDIVFDTPNAYAYMSMNGTNQTVGNISTGQHPEWAVIQNTEAGNNANLATLTIHQSQDLEFKGYLRNSYAYGNNSGGALKLIKQGTGRLIIEAGTIQTGGIDVMQGTLQIGDGGTIGSLHASNPVYVASGATLEYYRNDLQHVQGWVDIYHSISGDGSLVFRSDNGKLDANNTRIAAFDGAGGYRYFGNNNLSANANFVLDHARLQVFEQADLGVNLPTVVVKSGAQLLFAKSGTFANNLVINGAGWIEPPNWAYGSQPLGAIHTNSYAAPGTMTLTGNITLGSNAQITTWDSGTFAITGNIGDGGHGYSLTKTGGRTLELRGANTYTGDTIVRDGYLNLARTVGGVGAQTLYTTGATGNLVLGNNLGWRADSVVTFGANNQLGANVNVKFDEQTSGYGWLHLNGTNQTIGNILMGSAAQSRQAVIQQNWGSGTGTAGRQLRAAGLPG